MNQEGKIDAPLVGRKRPRDASAVHRAYASVRFSPVAPTGRPGTPHRYFQDSYLVKEQQQTKEESSSSSSEAGAGGSNSVAKSSPQDDDDETKGDSEIIKKNNSTLIVMNHHQVVHKHANGLAIVTAGEILLNKSIRSVEFVQRPAKVASESAAAKRKQQSKMLQGKQVSDVVRPNDLLARVRLENDNDDDGSTIIYLKACVWGNILEINNNLCVSPELLSKDPLLNGYLAVILPTGPFPPPPTTSQPPPTGAG